MKVKKVADLAGTTVRTVRYYHQIGLLPVPEVVGAQRDYDFTHVVRLLRIRWLVTSGVPLKSIGEILDSPADERAGDTAYDITRALEALDEQVSRLTHQRAALVTMLDQAQQGRRPTPLPTALLDHYDGLMASTSDPRVQQLIRDDYELAEVSAFGGLLPDNVAEAIASQDPDDLARQLHLFTGFAKLPDLDDDEARVLIADLVAATVTMLDRLGPEWRQVALDAWEDDRLQGLLPLTFTHRHHDTFTQELIAALSPSHHSGSDS